MKTYEKPIMTFTDIAPKKTIADACWSNIANGSASIITGIQTVLSMVIMSLDLIP